MASPHRRCAQVPFIISMPGTAWLSPSLDVSIICALSGAWESVHPNQRIQVLAPFIVSLLEGMDAADVEVLKSLWQCCGQGQVFCLEPERRH